MQRIISYYSFFKETKTASIHPKLAILRDFYGCDNNQDKLIVKGLKIEYFDETETYHVGGVQFKTPADVIKHLEKN